MQTEFSVRENGVEYVKWTKDNGESASDAVERVKTTDVWPLLSADYDAWKAEGATKGKKAEKKAEEPKAGSEDWDDLTKAPSAKAKK